MTHNIPQRENGIFLIKMLSLDELGNGVNIQFFDLSIT